MSSATLDADGIAAPEALDPKTANILYHDWEARSYDGKWAITFDQRCVDYASDKFLMVAPRRRYDAVLEVGAGTGFFIINLAQAGLIERPHATDISPGMVEVCMRNAEAAGVENMAARTADAEDLPYPDGTFDLVVGHAFLHHLPDVEAFFREAHRVLKPGGAVVVAGEPTRVGFQIVDVAKRGTARVMKGLGGRFGLLRDGGEADPEAALEAHVDLHEFHPHMVAAWARDAGFSAVRIRTDELLSGIFGWSLRTIEALARPGLLPAGWPWFAWYGYRALYRIDDTILRRIVPKPLFYNLIMYGEKA